MELGAMLSIYRYRRGETACRPYAEQLQYCYDAGFRVVDVNVTASTRGQGDQMAADDWERTMTALADRCAALGVRVAQMHAPYNANFFLRGQRPTEEYITMFREMNLRTVKAAAILGAPWIVVHPLTDTVNTEYDNDIQKRTNIEFYSEMLEAAKRAGVGLAFENMAEFKREKARRLYCAATDELIDLVDTVGHDVAGVCWDFGHARELYADQPRQLRKIGGRLKATHVHDNKGERDSHLIPFVGGDIKWEAIMPTLREIGYTGDFVFETHSYMMHLPEELRPAAGKLMHEFGEYCMEMYRA